MLSDADRLELFAEVDALAERLRGWADAAPDWEPVAGCRALVRRLLERTDAIRVRLEAPLVVATLGGTGTGKSALLNAILGDEVVATGRRRPTTTRPVLVCRPGVTAEALGIDPAAVELIQRDLPALREMVLIDCPDPDTTEEYADEVEAHRGAPAKPYSTGDEHPSAKPRTTHAAATNLARLRALLPHCDVLLVTATQQKYRSARVAGELAAAATGARLVFVQTHADEDEDVRDDWRRVLEPDYAVGTLFRVDSLGALDDARNGLGPRGDMAALVDLLTRQMAGAAAARIRRANLLDLAAETLERCRRRLDEALPGVEALQAAVEEQRLRLADLLARQMRGELLANRRQWENRLLGQTASRWGLSPLALVLRAYQGIGALLSGALLWRARTPAQLALWGAVEGARSWRRRLHRRRAEAGPGRAASACWEPGELRAAAVVLEGYAAEAGVPRRHATLETIGPEADRAAAGQVAAVARQIEALLARLARRHAGLFTRLRYELLLAAMLGWLLYRMGKNFYYDSYLDPGKLLGLDFYVQSFFWLALWCLVLIWMISGRLRRGLRREVDLLAEGWRNADSAAGLFAALEEDCRRAKRFRQDLDRLAEHVERLRRQLAPSPGSRDAS